MLSFFGSAFDNSPILREKYGAFLNSDISNSFFIILDDVCDWVPSIESNKAKTTTLENMVITGSRQSADCLLKCFNYQFLATDHFLRISFRSSYLRTLTEIPYLRMNEGIYQLARFRALFLDMIVLHASAIVYQGEVILFSGVSGSGKSTQARLWMENTDAWVLNYDKPVLSLSGDRVMVSGSPWGGKEDLSINEVRPAKALFFVHQAKENRIVRLSAAKAYAQAHLNYFVYPLNEEIEQRYNDAIIRLITKVPVYDLYCTDTRDAVEAVKRELY